MRIRPEHAAFFILLIVLLFCGCADSEETPHNPNKLSFLHPVDTAALVLEDGKWGLIDLNGDWIMKPQVPTSPDLENVFPGGGGQITFENPETKLWGTVDRNGISIFPQEYKNPITFRNGYNFNTHEATQTSGLLHEAGTFTAHPYDQISTVRGDTLFPFQEGELWGFMRPSGKVVLEPKWYLVGRFRGDYAIADFGKERDEKGDRIAEYGLIDREGKRVLEPVWQNLHGFNGEVLIAETETGEGVLNLQGEWMIPPKYYFPEYTVDEDYLVATLMKDYFLGGAKFGLMDLSGNWIRTPDLDEAYGQETGWVSAKFEGKWGMLDETGEWRIQPEFSNPIKKQGDRLILPAGDFSKIADTTGALVSEEKFHLPHGFQFGLVPAEKAGKQGFVDRNGNWAIPPKFEKVSWFWAL